MDEIDIRIRDTLLYIKLNPNCDTDSEGLDGFLVKDLHNQGLIEGCDITTISADSPEYGMLRINIDGEVRLSELSAFEKKSPALHKTLKIVAGFILLVVVPFFVGVAGYEWQRYRESTSQEQSTEQQQQETQKSHIKSPD